MKLLFIAPALPYPPLTGSSLIALNHIKRLSATNTVDLISFKHRNDTGELGDLPQWCNNIELVDRPARSRVALQILSRSIRDPHPMISRGWSANMSKVINQRLSNTAYDVVLFQTILSAQFRPDGYRGRTMWILEDPQTLKMQRMLPMYPWYSRPLHRWWIGRLKSYDMREAPRYGRVTFVNKDDAIEYKRSVPEASTEWVSHGIDDAFSGPSDNMPRRKGMIVITGNMFHLPNVDAVDFFCRDVFPTICARVPSANLWLVGSKPAERVRKWSKDPRINVTGFVPDVRTYLRQAEVSVCPMRLRIGTQTKLLEALSCGTPVVTSTAGNHGIGGVSGEHLYVADDPHEFAEHVITLLQGHRWNELSESGRRFVHDSFSWKNSAAKLEQVLEELIEAGGASSVSA